MGEVVAEGKVLVIRKIAVTYRLRVDDGVDDTVLERVLRVHRDACPVYRSIHPQIEVSIALDTVRPEP